MALPPNDAAYRSMGVESLVNGVWFHVLSQAFPFPKYIIAPEYRTGGGKLRGDLFVIRVAADPNNNKPIFAFEGKRDSEGSLPEFQAARTQLWGYLKDITKGGTRYYSFGVVAAGTWYAIQQNDGSNLKRRVESIPKGLGLGSGLSDNPGDPEFGIMSNAGEYDKVLQILRSIEEWIGKNVS